jgi:hypothetical protein
MALLQHRLKSCGLLFPPQADARFFVITALPQFLDHALAQHLFFQPAQPFLDGLISSQFNFDHLVLSSCYVTRRPVQYQHRYRPPPLRTFYFLLNSRALPAGRGEPLWPTHRRTRSPFGQALGKSLSANRRFVARRKDYEVGENLSKRIIRP